MIVGGFVKLSTLDWPGKLAAVVFTRGCNFCCPWCQNKSLVFPEMYTPEIPVKEVMTYLEKRFVYLDGVVVSGGEPTIHGDLPVFLSALKKIGFQVKLDTNGAHPEVLESLLRKQLVDALALDLKATRKKYAQAVGCEVNVDDIWKSILRAVNSGLPVWIRTTLVPGLINVQDKQELEEEIQKLIFSSANPALIRHVFQEYRGEERAFSEVEICSP